MLPKDGSGVISQTGKAVYCQKTKVYCPPSWCVICGECKPVKNPKKTYLKKNERMLKKVRK